MPKTWTSTFAALRLPRLAATAFICLTMGANTHVTAANTLANIKEAPTTFQTDADNDDNVEKNPAKNVQVLSLKDADLYRAAFAAQAKSEWAAADTAMANISDRKLLGHVLADRYQRRVPTQTELSEWLASYSDLPEASDFYSKARHMPAVKGTKITQPNVAANWNGGYDAGAPSGFKSEVSGKSSNESRRFASKINRLLRQGDAEAAKALLEAELKHRNLEPEEQGDIASRISASLFYDDQVADARVLADEALFGREPADQNPLALWIGGMSAWKQGDINAAGKFFVRLAAAPDLDPWDRAAADFWTYRAMKYEGDTSLARYWLTQASKQPKSFYGFLAVHLLGTDEIKSWQMPELTAENINTLSSHPAGWRALALLQIGQTSLAENELQHLNPLSNRALQAAMLAVAENAQMPTLAMKLGGIATNANGKRFDAALYPVPPWKPDQGFQVDRALIYALMRHESGFNPVAVSGSGACGLMQLMPATANLIANDNKVSGTTCSVRLLNPSYNMALGQKYVCQLANQPAIGNNLLLILAAYNGGPGNLAHWMDDDATRKDPLLFIESLPVHETRDYVQQVMIHYWNYCSRLSQPQTSLTQLSRGEWPRTTLHDTAPATEAPRTKQLRVMNDSIKLASYEQ